MVWAHTEVSKKYFIFETPIPDFAPIPSHQQVTTMSKTTKKRYPVAKMEERAATIAEVKRIPFAEIPEDLINLFYLEEDNEKRFYVFPLLRWAKRGNMLFDEDIVTFITVQQLKNSKGKGNFCLLKESEYPSSEITQAGEPKKLAKGVKIIMQKHPQYGWQPKRVIQKEDF
jgi:hypothetical protein